MTDFDYTPTKAEAKECFLDGAEGSFTEEDWNSFLGMVISKGKSPDLDTTDYTPNFQDAQDCFLDGAEGSYDESDWENFLVRMAEGR